MAGQTVKILTIAEVEWTFRRLKCGTTHEVEDCLRVAFQTFGRKNVYKGLAQKGAILFYLLVKSRPFKGGNAQMAAATLLVFLGKNGKWLKVDAEELRNFVAWVEASPECVKDETVLGAEKFIKKYLVNF
ncbi:MAG: hypothetical protein WC846_03435 [Candidatus Gracilibacteria bacterium]|jgi:prophage maintenance system killer protein